MNDKLAMIDQILHVGGKYAECKEIRYKLSVMMGNLNDHADQALLVDASHWIGKLGQSHAALAEVLKTASKLCDAKTFEALKAAAQRGQDFDSD